MFKLFSCVLLAVSLTATANDTPTRDNNSCPESWFDIQLPEGSKTCRIFGVKKPATLSFYINSTPENVSESLALQFSNAQTSRQGRYLTLQSENPQYRAYIFADGAGTQVNLMLN